MNWIQEQFGASNKLDVATNTEELMEKTQALEAALSSAKQKILQLESLPKPEPIIIFKEMGSNGMKAEQKDKATCTESDAVQTQTTDGSAASRSPTDHQKEYDTQVKLVVLAECTCQFD